MCVCVCQDKKVIVREIDLSNDDVYFQGLVLVSSMLLVWRWRLRNVLKVVGVGTS